MYSPDAIADHALLTVSRWQRTTPQQFADQLLSAWQARKHLEPPARLAEIDEYERDLQVLREVLGS